MHYYSKCCEVVHLHRFLPNLRCKKWEEIFAIGYAEQLRNLVCKKCGGDLKPDIVFFGEVAPMYERLNYEFNDCEIFVSIGSSGAVVNTDLFGSYCDL